MILHFQEAFTCTALQIHPNDSVFLAQCNAGYIAVFSQKPPYKLNKYKRFEGHSVCLRQNIYGQFSVYI